MEKNKKIIFVILGLIALGALAFFLYPEDVSKIRIPDAESVPATIGVESIDIQILESFPVQVKIVARGNLPDGCTTIKDISQNRTDLTFMIRITGERPADLACTQALVPFEKTIDLDVYGLKAGTYTVDVNGTQGTFELAADNVPTDGGK